MMQEHEAIVVENQPVPVYLRAGPKPSGVPSVIACLNFG